MTFRFVPFAASSSSPSGGFSWGAITPLPRTPWAILPAPAREEGAVQHVIAALGHLLGREQQTLQSPGDRSGQGLDDPRNSGLGQAREKVGGSSLLVWCSSSQVVMASWARRPVVGALAAFIIVAILAPHGSAHPRTAQPQCAVSDRVLRDRAAGAAGACPPAGRFPAHRHRRRHRIRVCFRQCTRCRPGRRDGVGRHRKERPRARDASGPWGSLLVSGPQGPVEWSDSGAPGRQRRGLAHESLSEVFHRVVSLWATFRGTTR